jgi:peptide deformylase
MTVKILQKEEEVLREIARDLLPEEIQSPRIQKVLKDMKEALESQDDGVAIAAPQIGESLRIFIVSRKVEEIIEESKRNKKNISLAKRTNEQLPEEIVSKEDIIFINPVIKKISKERKTVEEGCLSVRYLYGQVKRSTKATVEALDEKGRKFTRGGTGLMAQIFQHEMDHLDGVLFIDKAQNVEEIFPEHLKKLKSDAKK